MGRFRQVLRVFPMRTAQRRNLYQEEVIYRAHANHTATQEWQNRHP